MIGKVKTRFVASELEVKDTPEKLEIMQATFEYLLATVCQIHFNNMREDGLPVASLADFNEYNRLSITQLSVYPYFIATANDDYANALFNLFSEIRTLRYGPVSMPLFELLERGSSPLRFFDLDDKLGSIRIKQVANFEELSNATLFYPLHRSEDIPFKEIQIADNEARPKDENWKPIHEAIARSFNTLQEKTHGQFLRADENELVRAAKLNNAFNGALYKREIRTITFGDLGNQRERAFYLERQHP